MNSGTQHAIGGFFAPRHHTEGGVVRSRCAPLFLPVDLRGRASPVPGFSGVC